MKNIYKFTVILALVGTLMAMTACTQKKSDASSEETQLQTQTGTAVKETTAQYDYDKILKGDLSDFAGDWANSFGNRRRLRADGTFDHGESAGNFARENNPDYSSGGDYYRWTVSSDEYGFVGMLFPAGVDIKNMDEIVQSDKTQVRMIVFAHDWTPSADTVFYMDTQDEFTQTKEVPQTPLSDFQMADGTEILKYTGNASHVIIPSQVTIIGEMAFAGNHSMKGVTIPSSVTKIGPYAFSMCTSLVRIDIPSSVKEIGGEAFYECTRLTNVTLSRSTKIAHDSFPSNVQLDYLDEFPPSSISEVSALDFEGITMTVSENNVNIRNAPDTTSGKVIGKLNKNDSVIVNKRTMEVFTVAGQTAFWYGITSPVEGWVFGSFFNERLPLGLSQ
jgi:hypothetical protein